MDAISKMIKNGIEKNVKELKEGLIEINNVKEMISQGLKFDIYIEYNKTLDLLYIDYTFKKEEKEISVRFQMSELTFNFHATEISIELMKFALSYFNDAEYKVNIGSFDGDEHVGIREYINSFYDYDVNENENGTDINDVEEYKTYKYNQSFRKKSNLSITDNIKECEI